MAYPEKLLSDGESVVFEMRPHWRALVLPGVILLAEVFILVFVLGQLTEWFASVSGVESMSKWLAFLVGLFVLVVFVIRPFLYWITTQYVFTNRRIIVRSGLIARHGRDMPLSKVNNVSFDVSVAGRLLNYGSLTVDSASDEALIINDVPNVEQIQREVNRLHEEDDERRRQILAQDIAPPQYQQPPQYQPQPQTQQFQQPPTQQFQQPQQYPPQSQTQPFQTPQSPQSPQRQQPPADPGAPQ